MKNLKYAAIFSCLLCGCDNAENRASLKFANEESARSPQLMANTPFGNLYMFKIKPALNVSADRVYYLDSNTNQLTVNYNTGRNGHRIDAIMYINGVKYVQADDK